MTQLTIIDVFSYDTMNFYIVKRKIRRLWPPYSLFLLLAEGLAVGTLIHSGVSHVGAHQNPLQRTVVSSLAVMLALLDSTLNALVCMGIHSVFLLIHVMLLSCPQTGKTYISFHACD